MSSTLFVRRAAAACLFFWAFASAAAQARSTFDLSVDPRLELLGVVQRLADSSSTAPADGYEKDVDARFSRFKDHPAVRLYAETRLGRAGREGFGIDLLYDTAPPELALADPAAKPPYMTQGAEQETLRRFLAALRDFSGKSDFPGFFRAHRRFYRQAEAAARRELGPVDPAASIEAYLGIGLESRCHYYLTLLYRNKYLSSFIEPYPDPAARTEPVRKPFEVYTIAPYEIAPAGDVPHTDFGKATGRLWQEPLYVFIDPSFFHFLTANAPDPESFFRLEVPNCPPQGVNCAKALVVQALVDRLNQGAGRAPMTGGGGARARYVAALDARLEEYERRRDLYPTLWSFYPRLFAVFRELSPENPPAAPLRLPAGRILKTTDFFGSTTRPAHY